MVCETPDFVVTTKVLLARLIFDTEPQTLMVCPPTDVAVGVTVGGLTGVVGVGACAGV